MRDIMEVLKENYKIVEDMGYEVVGVFLQGSQNYNLAYEDSDIDCKAIIIPSIDNVVSNEKPISFTHVLPNDEHIDIKDIRLMFKCFEKQNVNFVEILFTKYKIMNGIYAHLFQPIFDNREAIARLNNYASINCMVGMGYEKLKALEHPYPSIIAKIEKYGYDPKQLHHIIRIHEFMSRWIADEPYNDCLISRMRDTLIDVKKGYHTLEQARSIAGTLVNELRLFKEEYLIANSLNIDEKTKSLMHDTLMEIIKYSFKIQINKGECK